MNDLGEASAIAVLVSHLDSNKCRKWWIKECRGLITRPEQKQLVALLLGESTVDDKGISKPTVDRYKAIMKMRGDVKRFKQQLAKTKKAQPISSVIYDLLQGVQHLNQERYNRSRGPGIPVEYAFDSNDRYLYLRHQDSGEMFRVTVERIDNHKNFRIM